MELCITKGLSTKYAATTLIGHMILQKGITSQDRTSFSIFLTFEKEAIFIREKDVLRMKAVLLLHHSSILKAAVNLLMATAPNIIFFGHVCKFWDGAETLFGGRL